MAQTILLFKDLGVFLQILFNLLRQKQTQASQDLNIREALRKEERERGRAEREGDTESEAGSRLRVASTEPDVGLELTNCEIMT